MSIILSLDKYSCDLQIFAQSLKKLLLGLQLGALSVDEARCWQQFTSDLEIIPLLQSGSLKENAVKLTTTYIEELVVAINEAKNLKDLEKYRPYISSIVKILSGLSLDFVDRISINYSIRRGIFLRDSDYINNEEYANLLEENKKDIEGIIRSDVIPQSKIEDLLNNIAEIREIIILERKNPDSSAYIILAWEDTQQFAINAIKRIIHAYNQQIANAKDAHDWYSSLHQALNLHIIKLNTAKLGLAVEYIHYNPEIKQEKTFIDESESHVRLTLMLLSIRFSNFRLVETSKAPKIVTCFHQFLQMLESLEYKIEDEKLSFVTSEDAIKISNCFLLYKMYHDLFEQMKFNPCLVDWLDMRLLWSKLVDRFISIANTLNYKGDFEWLDSSIPTLDGTDILELKDCYKSPQEAVEIILSIVIQNMFFVFLHEPMPTNKLTPSIEELSVTWVDEESDSSPTRKRITSLTTLNPDLLWAALQTGIVSFKHLYFSSNNSDVYINTKSIEEESKLILKMMRQIILEYIKNLPRLEVVRLKAIVILLRDLSGSYNHERKSKFISDCILFIEGFFYNTFVKTGAEGSLSQYEMRLHEQGAYPLATKGFFHHDTPPPPLVSKFQSRRPWL